MQCPKLNGIFSLTVVSPSESQGEAAAAAVSPEDLLATAVAENKAALEGELLKRALALDPQRADFHNNLGVLLRVTGNPLEAEAEFRHREAGVQPFGQIVAGKEDMTRLVQPAREAEIRIVEPARNRDRPLAPIQIGAALALMIHPR